MTTRSGFTHWFWRRAEPDEPEEEIAPVEGAQAPAALVVEVLSATSTRMLQLEIGGERVTDALNRHESITVRPVSGEGNLVVGPPETLELDDVLVLIPPPQLTDTSRRLHRPGHPVRVRVGPYEVIGEAHIPPGAQAVGFLLRMAPHFAPLTNASLREALTGSSRRARVAIVNLRRADLLREVTQEDA